jgi:hypothetical protein
MRVAHSELLKQYRQLASGSEVLCDVDEFIVRAIATGALLDSDEDRWAAQGLIDYWSTTLLRVGRTVSDATLADFDPALAPVLPDAQCPYLGLDAFQENDSERFFGRSRVVSELCALVSPESLTLVLGPSGSGKSSAVRSGLVPALKSGAIQGSEQWRYATVFMPGSEPTLSLARAVQTLGLGESEASDAIEIATRSSRTTVFWTDCFPTVGRSC